MSSVYATEPATSARVIFETTHGPLDIKLWCRECPATTKLFLQLCLDGFYDNLVFHRVVPSLLIQTGALRATTTGSSSTSTSSSRKGGAAATATTIIMANGSDGGSNGNSKGKAWEDYRSQVQAEEALERRSYELNPRLRFNHRGQVAMALEVDDTTDAKDMQPQFFITTESAPYLDRKHVIFGTLGSGTPTVFNAIRISGVAVDETTLQPVELDQAPRITATKIVESEIHTDLMPQASVPWRPTLQNGDDDDDVPHGKKKKKRKSMRKGKFDTNVLSFGDEVEDLAPLVKRPKSLKKLDANNGIEPKVIADSPVTAAREPADDDSSPALKATSGTATTESPPIASVAPGSLHVPTGIGIARSVGSERSVVPRDNAELQEGEAAVTNADITDEPVVSVIDQRRARYAKTKKTKQQREEETLAKLMQFRGKLKESVVSATNGRPSSPGNSNDHDNSLAARMARRHVETSSSHLDHDATEAYHGQILYNDNEQDDTGDGGGSGGAWLQTRFKCKRHIDHGAREREDEYEVIDEKGESRNNDRYYRRKK